MSAVLAMLIKGLPLLIKAAPVAETVYADFKNAITELFGAGLITKEQQDSLHAWADSHQAAVLANVVPPEFVVS
jgi:hypothetical protein